MKKRVFVNGSFDPLTPGHVSFLQRASYQGDELIVGLNSDESIRSYKGDKRPIVPYKQREAMLLALKCVDRVYGFDDEDGLRSLIHKMHVDVLVKGSDYLIRPITGSEIVWKRGGAVAFVARTDDLSASEIIRKCGDLDKDDLVQNPDESERY